MVQNSCTAAEDHNFMLVQDIWMAVDVSPDN